MLGLVFYLITVLWNSAFCKSSTSQLSQLANSSYLVFITRCWYDMIKPPFHLRQDCPIALLQKASKPISQWRKLCFQHSRVTRTLQEFQEMHIHILMARNGCTEEPFKILVQLNYSLPTHTLNPLYAAVCKTKPSKIKIQKPGMVDWLKQ
jgi:hypothetical protein